MFERGQVFFVLGAVRHVDVERARRLRIGVVIFLMDREREHRLIRRENGRRAVAVVDICVNGYGSADKALFLQAADGDGDVVQHAEAFAVVWEGVVESAAQVRGNPVFERQARGAN